ncbi:DUF202 domain-containing protein [Salinibacterium sp.]|uniref:YidH family protein n=1 Tax=Salinibacterium sp. TaxID=1915057 RepID=UPI00286BF30C|nr:DUF202 domain-containing protein [Salinibacterium sp.]
MARRFPGAVYSRGTEPDPRISLANERTFLSWIRTALALVAAGVALEALDLPIAPGLRFAAAILFVVLGLIAAAFSWVSWARTELAMRLGSVLPGPSLSVIIAAGVVVAIALVGVGLLI